MKLRIAFWLGCCLAAPLSAQEMTLAESSRDPVIQAQGQARAKRMPLLVDFQAPWCYSCYYMAKNVLNGPEWDKVGSEMVRLELDADSPEGARWMKSWDVKVLPTYVVFDADARELGRILGEQTRPDFYAWLSASTARTDTLDGLKARVVDAGEPSLVAAREVLKTYHARYDAKGGLAWYTSLTPPAKTALARDDTTTTWVARLELQRAAAENEPMACSQAAEQVLSANLGCERPYELQKVMDCTASQTPAERGELLRPQAELMQLLVDKRVLSGSHCADERSVVLVTADLYKALGDKARETKVLDRAIEDLKKRIDGDVKKDRNLSDNLRVYLDRAGRTAELDQLFPRLIEAFPEDYVYAFRFGKSLAARGKHAEAVAQFEKAAEKAYGVNRLRNAELRARSLIALNRKVDAWKVIGEALDNNGPWFPEDVARLQAIKGELSPSSKPAT